jgi:hypothetical protein
MTKTPIWAAAALAAMALLGEVTTAEAAGREFCESYARAAVNQVRGALSNRRCEREIHGDRWSPEYRVHFDWCLGVSPREADTERDIRTDILRRCTGQ